MADFDQHHSNEADRPERSVFVSQGFPVLVAAMLASFMVVLDQSCVNLAIADLVAVFGVPVESMQMVVSGQLMVLALTIPATGFLLERFGRRQIYLLAIALVSGANLLAGAAPSFSWLAAARLSQGIGAGLLLPTTMAMVIGAYPGELRGRAVGLWVSGATAALLVGPVLGGWLVDGPGWRWVFWVSLPLAVVAVAWGGFRISSARAGDDARRFDLIAYLFLAGALLFFMVPWEIRDLVGLPTSVLVASQVVSVVCLVSLVRRIRSGKDDLLPLPLFRDRAFRLSLWLTLVRAVLLYGGVFFLPLFVQEVLGYSARNTGFILFPTAVTVVVCTPFIGRATDRYNPGSLVLAGVAILAAMHLVMLIPQVQNELWLLVPVLMVRAIGICLLVTPTVKAAFTTLNSDLENTASTAINLCQRMGGAVTIAIVGKVIGWVEGDFGFTVAIVLFAAVSIPAAYAAWLLTQELKQDFGPLDQASQTT